MKEFRYYLQPIFWVYMYLPIIGLCIALFIGYSKVAAEITMCKTYYPEVSTWNCYWMPKQLPVRTSK